MHNLGVQIVERVVPTLKNQLCKTINWFSCICPGHTLRLLNLPDFVGASLEKFIKLRRGLKKATGLIRGLFGTPDEEDQVAFTEADSVIVASWSVLPAFQDHNNRRFYRFLKMHKLNIQHNIYQLGLE